MQSLRRREPFTTILLKPAGLKIRALPILLRKSTKVNHYNDVIMSALASQITSVSIVYSTVGSGANQRKHQSSAALAFGREIHR